MSEPIMTDSSPVSSTTSIINDKKSDEITRMKIVIMGAGGVGKTTFVDRLTTGEFTTKYNPTLGVSVTSVPTNNFLFNNPDTKYVIDVWDTAGQEEYSGLKSDYYHHADGAIVMYDVHSKLSYQTCIRYIQSFRQICPNAPIVLCGNKIDIKPSKGTKIVKPTAECVVNAYYDLSCKSYYNLDKPLEYFIISRNKVNEVCNFVPFPDNAIDYSVLRNQGLQLQKTIESTLAMGAKLDEIYILLEKASRLKMDTAKATGTDCEINQLACNMIFMLIGAAKCMNGRLLKDHLYDYGLGEY